MTFLQSAIACSTAGFTCSGFIFENSGKGEFSNKGFVIVATKLIKDNVDVMTTREVFKGNGINITKFLLTCAD